MKNKIRVVLVDDNEAFLEGLCALFESEDQFEVLASFTSGEALLKYNKLNSIDLLLLDVEMPGLNGIQTARLINFDYSRIKILAITMYQDKVYLTQLIEAGFLGFVNKTDVSDELFETISKIMNGELCFPESIL